MNELDLKVMQMVSDYKKTNSNLDNLNSLVQPYATPSALFDTLIKMKKEDSDYIRKYLKGASNIVYQKDITIENKANYMYNELAFNNDSQYLSFYKNRVMVTCEDYAIYGREFDFYVDLFINGVRINPKNYLELPSYDKYNFKTGCRRFFIEENLVETNDEISIVVRKQYKMNSAYKKFIINSTEVNTYKFNKVEVGNYGDILENLLVYRKDYTNKVFTLVPRENYSLLDNLDNTDQFIFTINESLVLYDEYYIMNKCKHYEINYHNTTDYTFDEYMEYAPKMTLDLIDNVNKLPLPIECIEDIEIFVDGYRLINGVDFIYEVKENKNPMVRFAGILKLDSDILIRNKNLNNPYSFYKRIELMGDVLEDYTDYLVSTGIIDLREFPVPIGEDYVEAYLGRIRVPLNDKRSILNLFMKIDDQHITFNNLELYTEFMYTNYVEQLLNNRENEKEIYSQLRDVNADWVKDAWLYIYTETDEFDEDGNKLYIQEENNPMRPNDANNINNIQSPFLERVNRIELLASPSIVTEGRTPEFTVIAYYKDDEAGIDVTEYSDISYFDPNVIGEQTITASFTQGNEVFTNDILIKVIHKEIAELKIRCNSNFFVVGDPIRSNTKVIAVFEDNTEREIPLEELASYSIPERAEEVGGIYLTANYNYNNTTKKAEKAILISDTSDRMIKSIEIIVDNTINDNDEYINSKLRVFATYTNIITHEIDTNSIDVYLLNDINNPEVLEENKIDPNNFVLGLNNSYPILLKVYTNSNKETSIPFVLNDEQTEFSNYYITTIQIIENVLTNGNRILTYDNSHLLNFHSEWVPKPEYYYWRVKDINTNDYISVGKHTILESSITLADVYPGQLVIVELLDINEEIIDQLVFIIHDANRYRETINGNIEGNISNGYTVTVSKVALGMNLNILLENDIRIIDNNGNVIGELLIDRNDPFNSNNANGYPDKISESTSLVQFKFINYSINNGNVFQIYESVKNKELELYLDIVTYSKLIKLENLTNDPEYHEFNDYTYEYDTSVIDSQYVIINPVLPEGLTVNTVVSMRPINTSKLLFDFAALSTEMTNNKGIKYPIDKNNHNSLLIDGNRIGNNYYYYYMSNGDIYRLNVEVKLNSREILVIDNINKIPFEEN